MLNELKIFKNNLFEVAVKLDNGEILFDAERVAKSLGFISRSQKNGKIYENVRWSRINEFLPQVAEEIKQGDLISEPMVYKLAFKANNEAAEIFQDWLAIEVIPTIRKTGTYKMPMTKKEEMKLYVEALEEQDAKIEAVNKDLQNFKLDMPLLGMECEKITTAVRKVGVNCLNGKATNAYRNRSIRAKVYADIHGQLKREFAVSTYKAIKRNQVNLALNIINNYKAPYALNNEIYLCNRQIHVEN